MHTAFLIDGFNFYHSIKSLDRCLRWFDYKAYCQHFMRSSDTLHSITYFTALAFWRPGSAARHKIFIEANKANGIKIVLGKFKERTIHCPSNFKAAPPGCAGCSQQYPKHEEKATDVNIALYGYRLASKPEVDQVVFVTVDTDLIPAVKVIKEDFPAVRVGAVFPFRRAAYELICEVDFHHRTRQNILHQFQLPNHIQNASGKIITRPAT